MIDRRRLFGAAAAAPFLPAAARAANNTADTDHRVTAAFQRPVLSLEGFNAPVTIEKVDLLKRGEQFFVRVRSTDGAEGLCLTHRKRIAVTYPIFLKMTAPHFRRTDARLIEQTVEDVFRHGLNYKFQGLAFWINVAWIELAVLDMLGKIGGFPVSGLVSPRVRETTGVYYANSDRESPPEAVVRQLEEKVAETGAKAVKHKLGARMRYDDASNARDRTLAPLMRKRLGDDITIYADANGSFDYNVALDMGRMLSGLGYGFFEEPVQFDDLWTTQRLTAALDVPVAGGEQETSMRRFRWQIENNVVNVHQPDLLFFGGFTRATRVARMAGALGKLVVPHMSGYGLGSLHVLHFASVTPNTTPFQEWKGDKDGLPYEVHGTGRPLTPIDGEIAIPQGPGLGVAFDPEYLNAAEIVRL